ncbi:MULTISPECIES: LacI family DNA-binding transcriptional regulator [unclassified Sphingomonas]|uniref:LacI family DNA-binding transcriptional regulator n=1 Tax=unclassified Sphingomonas TaxID=196159 RepID=UPI00226AACED|nr:MULTISPECIES: LacI family DNA-binding transcriptional regulator [unclassified Sphingomonas]
MQERKRRDNGGATIRTVAAQADVSAMTVSNVINGTGKVSEPTRRRVELAIKQLDYQPNAAARGLANSRTSRLGIVYERPWSAFVSAALVGALEETSALGVQLLTYSSDDVERHGPEQAMRSLVKQGAGGLLLLPPFAEAMSGTPFLAKLGVPVGTISTGCSLPDILTVRIDERAAAQALTRLLIDHGHHRIGFITGPPTHSGSAPRRDGYERELRAAGLSILADLVAEGDYTFESGLRAAVTLLDRDDPPSAIFAANDEMAAATAWTALRLGIPVPDGLALVGFDDTPLAERVFPPLTAAHQPIGDMARRATDLLVGAMRRPDERQNPQDIIVGHTIVERKSTGFRMK